MKNGRQIRTQLAEKRLKLDSSSLFYEVAPTGPAPAQRVSSGSRYTGWVGVLSPVCSRRALLQHCIDDDSRVRVVETHTAHRARLRSARPPTLRVQGEALREGDATRVLRGLSTHPGGPTDRPAVQTKFRQVSESNKVRN